MNNYPTLEDNIKYIIDSDYAYFLNIENVVGIGFGYKVKNGFYTDQECIQIFVSNKISLNKLSSNNVIPCIYKGIPTDVVETGNFEFLSLKKKIRPVQGGYSMSTMDLNNYGSVGCLVSNGVLNFVLGTNHVMANFNQFPMGTPLLQPAHIDGGIESDEFATLYKYIPIRFIQGSYQPVNFSDAAIGLLTDHAILSPKIALIGKLNTVKNPKIGEDIKKVGRTSGLTYGTVSSTNAVIIINVSATQSCLFKDLTLTTAIGSTGDSGALLINKSNNALGILFSGTEVRTAYCRLSTVLDQLGVHLVT